MLAAGPGELVGLTGKEDLDDGVGLLAAGRVPEVEPDPAQFELVKVDKLVLHVVNVAGLLIVGTKVESGAVDKRPDEHGQSTSSHLGDPVN